MPTLEDLIASLPARPDAAALVAGFVPPGRFAEKRFESYDPRHPTQEAARARLRAVAAELHGRGAGVLERLRTRWRGGDPGRGVYLDGGFGVGKTHLLAALWYEAPEPKAYLSFDQLVAAIPLVRSDAAAWRAFTEMRLVAVDEWELDDPGNLKLALSCLRDLLANGATVAATSNTLPLDLGAGRFSQKDFRLEIEELAGAFEVVRIRGEDYRHRHYEVNPGLEYFVDREALLRRGGGPGDRVLLTGFPELLRGLATLHPVRYRELIGGLAGVSIDGLSPLGGLPEALRLVHFIDGLYDSAVSLAASSAYALGELFPPAFLAGPYGKKCSRCLSRLEEMLSETADPGTQ